MFMLHFQGTQNPHSQASLDSVLHQSSHTASLHIQPEAGMAQEQG